MRVERLREVIAAVGREPSAEELAETLWLAAVIARVDPARRETPAVPPPMPPTRPPERRGARQGGPGPHPSAPPEERDPGEARFPLLSTPSPPPSGDTAVDVLVPRAPTIEGQLEFLRALRPLKRRVPSPRLERVDEEATAELIAEQRRRQRCWAPILSPTLERWLDVAVVVDNSESMTIWRRLSRDMWRVLLRSGVFRDVTLWWASGTTAGGLVVSAAGGGIARHPAELVDPGGRRAILVLSDCVGPAWRSGSFGRTLHRWAGHGPVAVLQPLPERLWSRTGAPTLPGVLSCPEGGAPNVRLRFAPFDGMGSPEGHTPVPVLELSPPWLRRWARLVDSGATTPAAVTFASGGQAAMPRLAEGSRLSAEDRVRHFRAVASPDVFRLAGYVAMTTPTLPIMQHVHRAMTPNPWPIQLAEVILSGLLRAVEPGTGEYEFIDGVEEVLLDTVARTDALRLEDLLIRIAERIEASGPGAAEMFRALLGVRGGYHSPPPGSRRFALLSGLARRRLRAVSVLALAPAPAPDSPAAPDTGRPAMGAGSVGVAPTASGPASATGWLLGGGLVLTAGPDAREGGELWVRAATGPAHRGHVRRCIPNGAVLVEVPSWAPDDAVFVTWGALVTAGHPVACDVRPAPPAPPLAGRLLGRPDGRCDVEPPMPEAAVGGPVFSGDLLVGTVVGPTGREVAPAVALLYDRVCADLLSRHGITARAVPVELRQVLEATPHRRVTIGGLLDPHATVVRFTGRADEMRVLRGWCAGSGRSLRLMTARGGNGKTRLAVELVADLMRADWVAGFLTADAHERFDFAALARVRAPLLVVLDEADVNGVQARALIEQVSANPHGYPIRVLLLARSSGDWWDDLRQWAGATGASIVDNSTVDRLGALAPLPAARGPAFTAAVEDFDLALESLYGPRSWAPADRTGRHPPDLSAPPFGHALDLHAEALAAALRRREPHLAAQLRDAVERAAVRREQEYAERAAIEVHLSYASADVLDECIACVHLLGASTAAEARRLVARVLGSGDRDANRTGRFVRWLHDMYPGPEGGYCGPVAPEVVGLRLAEEIIGREPDRLAALLPLASGGRAEQVRGLVAQHRTRFPRLAAMLARDAGHEPPVSGLEPSSVEPVPRQPQPAAAGQPQPTPSQRAPEPTRPVERPSGRARRPAPAPPSGLTVPQPSADERQSALAQLRRAGTLRAAGENRRAIAAALDAVRLLQPMVTFDARQYLPSLAAGLHLLALLRCEEGQLEQGARSFRAAVDTYRHTLDDHPELVSTLAAVLVDQGEQLRRWQPDVAIQSYLDAAAIYGDLLRNDPRDSKSRAAVVKCYEALATLLRAEGRVHQAARYVTRARLIAEMIDDTDP